MNQRRRKKTKISFKFRALAPSAAFTQKLHLIYLINDLLHHWLVELAFKFKIYDFLGQKCDKNCIFSVKKSADDLKNSLESVVIPMFCNATISK